MKKTDFFYDQEWVCKGFGALKLFLDLSVCVWILWSKLEEICIKKIIQYIAHWDSRGVKSSKQRAEVSTLSSVESVKMQRDG